jgi:hypothetical protein
MNLFYNILSCGQTISFFDLWGDCTYHKVDCMLQLEVMA